MFNSFFATGPPLFEGGRAWGVLQKGIAWLMDRERPIRQAWSIDSLQRFGANRQDGGAGGGEEGALIAKADEAIGSNLFWAFLHFLQCTSDALDRVFQWMQSCPCHPPHIRDQLSPVLGHHEHLRCPMKGLRAPELCTESFLESLDVALALNESELMVRHLVGLSDEDKGMVVADWSKLAAFVRTSFKFKLSPWKALPLLIVGLGHGSLSTARRLLWQALAQYESMTVAEKEASHELTRQLFSPSRVREQLESFLRGEDIADLPDLSRLRMEAMFIPILEQSIERRHAVVHQRILSAHNHSGPYISVIQRSHELEDLLSQPGQLQTMADLCSGVRTPALVIRTLGLQMHSEVAEWFQASPPQESKTPHKTVASLVYRCDPCTQFSRFAVEIPRRPDHSKSSLTDAADADREDSGDEGPRREETALQDLSSTEESWQKMLCDSAWDHFRRTSSSEVFFSMAPRLCGAALSSLEDAITPESSVPQPVLQAILDQGMTSAALQDVPLQQTPLALEYHNDDGQSAEPNTLLASADSAEHDQPEPEGIVVADVKDVFVFRLLCGSLHRRKRARTDLGTSLQSSEVVVQHHRIREVYFDEKEVLVYLDAAGSSSDNKNLLSHPSSLASIKRWEMLETSQVLKHVHLPAQAEAALDALCKSQGQLTLRQGADAAAEDSVAKHVQGLNMLESRGYVQRGSEENGAVTWSLETSTYSKLCAVVRLGRASDFAKPRASQMHGGEAKNMTLMELMLHLQQKGFVFEQLSPPVSEEPQPFSVQRQGPKKMFLKPGAGHFSRLYLLALAEPSLKNHGVTSVRHCQKDKYYAELLVPIIGSQPSKKRHLKQQAALTFDVDAGIAAPGVPTVGNQVPVPRRVHGKRKEHAEASEVPPPPPAAIADDDDAPGPKAKARPARKQHEKSHSWGAGYITFKPPNSWQAACHRKKSHRHALGKNTRCTRTRCFSGPEQEQQVLRQLRHWLNSAKDYDSRLAHMAAKPASAALVASPGFDARLERERVPDDYESQSEQEGPAPSAPASASVAPDSGAVQDEAASDPDDDDSSSSSDSSSSGNRSSGHSGPGSSSSSSGSS